jgi:Domain of unknown function (DUF4082)
MLPFLLTMTSPESFSEEKKMKALLHRRRGSRRPRDLLIATWLAVLVSGEEPLAQTISIFGNAVPNDSFGSKNALTLGVKFWSSQSGTISAIRFYRAVANPSGYLANLYTAGGALLASTMLSRDTCSVPCWEVANFASPISISANTSYVAAYYSSVGAGASDSYGLSNGVTNGPLTAPASSAVGGNGVYQRKNAFPINSYEASNYYVDVLFTPTERSLVLNFNPPNPSIPVSAPLGLVVATIIPSWSDGSPFTGTLSFAPPYSNDQGTFAISGNNLIINPSGLGVSADGNTVQNVTIGASQ